MTIIFRVQNKLIAGGEARVLWKGSWCLVIWNYRCVDNYSEYINICSDWNGMRRASILLKPSKRCHRTYQEREAQHPRRVWSKFEDFFLKSTNWFPLFCCKRTALRCKPLSAFRFHRNLNILLIQCSQGIQKEEARVTNLKDTRFFK